MIPDWLVALITFPGIVVHELAHLFFCKLLRVRVLKVCLFRLGDPAGYVIHEKPDSVYQSLLISVGPFLFNTIAGALMGALGQGLVFLPEARGHVSYVLIWLGVSIAMHAFPSTGDAKAMWQAMWSNGSSAPAKLIGTPLLILIYAGALGSIFWMDAIYGISVAMLLPKLLINLPA